MADAIITLTSKRPPPPEADFAFYIDFARGRGSPSRVFTATADFIKACERLDGELVKSVDSSIDTVMVLEDIEASSLKTWLKSALESSNEDSLKTSDWKKRVRAYLVKAKFAILKWADEDDARDLPSLSQQIQKIAEETDVRHLPDYAPPTPQTLLTAIADFQSVKDRLHPDDRVAVVLPNDRALELDLSVKFSEEDLEELAVREIVDQPNQKLILIVKKPDFLGDSMWELRLGRKNIPAKMADVIWLKKFQEREVEVHPGDSLRCEVTIQLLYGHDNELIGERYTVTKVVEVLPNTFKQGKLFDDKKS